MPKARTMVAQLTYGDDNHTKANVALQRMKTIGGKKRLMVASGV